MTEIYYIINKCGDFSSPVFHLIYGNLIRCYFICYVKNQLYFNTLFPSKIIAKLKIILTISLILGEFGNLIAGDARSAPLVQFRLLHSKYHLCSQGTRALLLTTYVKFINLFPEIKTVIEDVFKLDSNLR